HAADDDERPPVRRHADDDEHRRDRVDAEPQEREALAARCGAAEQGVGEVGGPDEDRRRHRAEEHEVDEEVARLRDPAVRHRDDERGKEPCDDERVDPDVPRPAGHRRAHGCRTTEVHEDAPEVVLTEWSATGTRPGCTAPPSALAETGVGAGDGTFGRGRGGVAVRAVSTDQAATATKRRSATMFPTPPAWTAHSRSRASPTARRRARVRWRSPAGRRNARW